MPYSEPSKKQKPPRLRFDYLRGNTAWERLITWTRRRRWRAFFVYSAVLLSFFGLMILAIFQDTTILDFWVEFYPIAMLLLVYLLPWGWLLLWIIAPEKHHQIRRLKQLGDFHRIAAALEEDLGVPDGIPYQKGGAMITRRFIVYTGFFSFFLYPLEGLIRYDDTPGTQMLYYENGKSLKVNASVPLRRMKKHLPGYICSAPVKKMSIGRIIWIAVSVILIVPLIFIIAANDSGNIIAKYAPMTLFICFFLYILLAVVNIGKSMKNARLLSGIKDPDEKIRKLEEMNAAGKFRNAEYLNLLSSSYYDKGDTDKALALIREALAAVGENKGIRVGRLPTGADVYRLNEITYLLALKRVGEAEQILGSIDEKRYSSNLNILYNITTIRAEITVQKGDAQAAREFLCRARALPLRCSQEILESFSWHLTLLEAACDILEHDEQTALSKLNYIVTNCAFLLIVRRAEGLLKGAGQ